MTTRRSSTNRLADQLQRRREALRDRPRLYGALLVVSVLLLAAIAWPLVLAHLQSLAVLDLVANKQVPWPLREMVTEPVTTRELTLPLASGPVRARIYIPLHHPNAPGLLVLHGVHHLGMDEPRMIAFASAMASCGLRVLTPELPGIKDYHVDQDSIATIGDSAHWLAAQQQGRPVGVLGLSFSGGLALIAASDARWHPYIRFILAVGSQDNMERVAVYYRTGLDARPDGTVESLPPHEYGPLVLEYEHLPDFVPNPADQAPIRAVLRAHLYEDPPAERIALAQLTPAQHELAETLMRTSSPTTRELLHASEGRHLAYAHTISPHYHIAHLTTPVYLLHGEADNIIPSAESLWLANDLPRDSLKALLISPVLSHLDLDAAKPTPWDELRLVYFFALVVHAAEAR